MSHLPKVRLRRDQLLDLIASHSVENSPFNEFAEMLMAASAFGAFLSQLFEFEEARNVAKEEPKTPQDLAILALQLWKQGTWTKEHAMQVVHKAVGEYREHIDVYSQQIPAYRAALPPGIKQTEAQLIDQLFA
ncbi:MAG: hypothetical protein AAGA60_27005 [Cyanobacteria bacterium P01_E01_bin.42]